jgi:hypothetical protein
MKKSVIFSVIAGLSLAVPIHGQKAQSQPNASAASPQAVCAYIVGRMTSALPQQPTLCSGKQEQASGYYSISIFSPKNVLEGDARRAWSSALFQTLEDLVEEKSLNGACSTTPICDVTVSDAYMAQHNWRYRKFLDKDRIFLLRGKSTPSALAEFSEHWYTSWWRSLFTLKESDNPGSEENAKQIGQSACEDYIAAFRKRESAEFVKKQEDLLAKEGGTQLGTVELGHPVKSELPSCSVMLANDKNIYIALDFPSLIDALDGDNLDRLAPTFGSWFDNTGYDGQVVIRSPWMDNGGNRLRVYYIFPLRAIEFVYEEKESGARGQGLTGDMNVGEMLRAEFFVPGQMDASTFESSPLANAALLRYTPGSDETVLVDMTDGTEWKVSKESFDRCNLHPGDKIDVSTLSVTGNTASTHGPPVLSTQKDAEYCKLTASFVKGW